MPQPSHRPAVARQQTSPPPPGTRGWRRWFATPATLWSTVLLAVTLDATVGLQSLLTPLLNAILSLLFLPWMVLVLRAGPNPEGPASGRLRGVLLQLGMITVALGLLVSKWWVLERAVAGDPSFAMSSRNYGFGLLAAMTLGLASRGLRAARLVMVASERPARLMATSFGLAGAAGAFLLSLPISLNSLGGVSLVDNLFMAFSAVCVTGLAVRNVAETYTLFGQGVLCVLIQVGGLGIMVLSAAIAVLAGQRLRVRSRQAFTELVDGAQLATLRRTVLMICVYTLLLEALGALLLYPQFREQAQIATRTGGALSGAGSPEWAAVFHAVSAFCNAGFSNFQAGLAPMVGNAGVELVVIALIVLGGIGFPVLDELARRAFGRLLRRRRLLLTLSTRVALWTSAALLVGVAGGYFLLEWGHSFAGLGFFERVMAALFQSASARTAGFNVVDVGAMLPSTLVLTCAAMFIGASPGSTGGGIKTTTLAVLFAGLRAELTGRAPNLLGRQLPEPVIRKAIGVSVMSMLIVLVAFFLLLLFESHPPLDVAFEVVSAFSTTGLSTGITGQLSVPGRLLITLVMFIGRIGPLTLALAMARTSKPSLVALPEERVMIG